MTPSQIRLVQKSFVRIEPIATEVGARFYNRLFRMAPETRALFKGDMSYQHAKFMSVIRELVNLHLRALISLPVTGLDGEAAMPGIRNLGRDHAKFGVVPAHFGLMRTALMETLEEVLGEEFTPEIQVAWAEAYDVMAKVMKGGLMNTSPQPQLTDRFAHG
jgi:hemoglobin-like flavoprotein